MKSSDEVLSRKLKAYLPFIEAIAELFHPFVEIAVHDLIEDKLVALYHNISQRKVGDQTTLGDLKQSYGKFPDFFSPYYKKNWDGRKLKCTSITLRDDQGEAIGLICINVDTTFFTETKQIVDLFLAVSKEAESPIESFGEDCQNVIKRIVDEYLLEYKLNIRHLNRVQKREAVHSLYQRGAFNYKNAPPFIAEYLNISRATVYNYLKELSPHS
jgi:predicted transcriptional regulator YheO